jgi:hypothetical protein
MSSVLERRLSRLEQAARSSPDERMDCEVSDEAKDILRTVYDAMGMTLEEIEARVNQRYLTPCDHVADLSPVARAAAAGDPGDGGGQSRGKSPSGAGAR